MSHVLTKNPNWVTRQDVAASSGLPLSFLHGGLVYSRRRFDRFDVPCHGSCFLCLMRLVLRLPYRLLVFPFEFVKGLLKARSPEWLTSKSDFGATSHRGSASYRFTTFPSGDYFCIYSQRRLYRTDLGIVM